MKVYAQCLAQVSNFIVKIVFKREIHTVNGVYPSPYKGALKLFMKRQFNIKE